MDFHEPTTLLRFIELKDIAYPVVELLQVIAISVISVENY
jgi:hypothetical protein